MLGKGCCSLGVKWILKGLWMLSPYDYHLVKLLRAQDMRDPLPVGWIARKVRMPRRTVRHHLNRLEGAALVARPAGRRGGWAYNANPFEIYLLEMLRRLERDAQGPVHTRTLAVHLGMGERTTRHHLNRLEGRGAVERPAGIRRGYRCTLNYRSWRVLGLLRNEARPKLYRTGQVATMVEVGWLARRKNPVNSRDNTWHYRVDVGAVNAALEGLYTIKNANPSAMDAGASAMVASARGQFCGWKGLILRNITTEHNTEHNTEHSTTDKQPMASAAVLELVSLGLKDGLAKKLVREHGEERVREVVAASAGKDKPGGWVMAMLRNGWQVVVSAGTDKAGTRSVWELSPEMRAIYEAQNDAAFENFMQQANGAAD